jgi:hypothetical protein
MAYIELEDFLKAKLPEIANDDEKDALSAMLEAASAYVDKATKRKRGYFAPAEEDPTTRYFQGWGGRPLRIPVHVLGSVTVEGIADESFYEHEDSGWLYIKRGSAIGSSINISFDAHDEPCWKDGCRYSVSARWGYEETPPDIVEAVSQITVRWWETQKGTLGQAGPSGFIIERAVPPAVVLILGNYAKQPFEI